MFKTMRHLIGATGAWIAVRLQSAAVDDRGEVSSSTLFIGAMVILAGVVVGIVAAGTERMANAIPFDLP